VQLLADGEPVEAPEWRRQRVRSLLTYLAMHRSVSRWQLAEDLWPDLDPEAQARNLRVTLTYLLRVLEPARGQRNPSFFIRQHGDLYTIEPGDWLTVDLWEAAALRNRAVEADRRGAPAEVLDHSLRAVELWRDEPTELTVPWASAPLEQCRLGLAETGTRAGELLLAQGDVDRALALAERALTLDPWREASHRLLVTAYVARDDRLAARRALKRYRDRIDELGIAPDEATTMVERLLDSIRLDPDQSSTGSGYTEGRERPA
jgi:DNA-binding SARP family transcriptional activator